MVDEPRHFTPAQLNAFTPTEAKALGMDLAIHCDRCRMLRSLRLERLIAARPSQPIAAMTFRCSTCHQLGMASLSWRDTGNSYRSFFFEATPPRES